MKKSQLVYYSSYAYFYALTCYSYQEIQTYQQQYPKPLSTGARPFYPSFLDNQEQLQSQLILQNPASSMLSYIELRELIETNDIQSINFRQIYYIVKTESFPTLDAIFKLLETNYSVTILNFCDINNAKGLSDRKNFMKLIEDFFMTKNNIKVTSIIFDEFMFTAQDTENLNNLLRLNQILIKNPNLKISSMKNHATEDNKIEDKTTFIKDEAKKISNPKHQKPIGYEIYGGKKAEKNEERSKSEGYEVDDKAMESLLRYLSDEQSGMSPESFYSAEGKGYKIIGEAANQDEYPQ